MMSRLGKWRKLWCERRARLERGLDFIVILRSRLFVGSTEVAVRVIIVEKGENRIKCV